MIKALMAAFTGLALTAAAQASDLSTKSWDDIIAQAKQEGQVTFTVWYLTDEFRAAVKPFEDEYGIKVSIPNGTADAFRDKLLAESGATSGGIDVFARNFNDYENLDLEALFHNLAALPADPGRISQMHGVDGQGYVLAYWGNQTGISYDPDKVSEADLPQTPDQFAAFWAEHPGKFGFNYEKGGSGPSFYQNTIRAITDIDLSNGEVDQARIDQLAPGLQFFREHAENYVITASNGDSIVRVSDGELWMAPGWEDHVAGLQKRGEIRKSIRFYVPEMGMYGGGNGVAIPKNARHPAAALVFVNWLTSAATQSAFNATFGTAPMHADADDSNALVSNEQRAHSRAWGANPFRGKLEETFIEDVIQER